MNPKVQKITRRIVVFAIILLGIGIVVGIIFQGRPEEKKDTTYPGLGIRYEDPNIGIDNLVNTLSFPEKIPVVKKSVTMIDRDLPAKAVASSFGIEDDYERFHGLTKLRQEVIRGEEVYTWVDGNKLLTYYIQTGVFEYGGEFVESTQEADEEKAKQTVITFLTTNNILPAAYDMQVEYILVPGLLPGTKDNFSLYHVVVIPKINNLPVLSYKNDGKIIDFLLNKDFSFAIADYLYIPIESTTQTHNLRNIKDVLSDVKGLKIQPSFLDLENIGEEPDLSKIRLTTIQIKDVELVYYIDPKEGETILPTYKITALIEDVQGRKGSADFMVRASK